MSATVTEIPEVRELLARRAGRRWRSTTATSTRRWGGSCGRSGFDRTWVGGDRAYLIDADGERYLDLISGYGVFALGRNHPDVIAAVHDVLAAGTANLPAARRDAAERRARRAAARARAGQRRARWCPRTPAPRRSRPRSRSPRAATGRPRVLYADHAFHGLTLGSLSLNGNEEFRDGLRAAPARLRAGRRSATSTRSSRELARGDVAALIVEPVQGKGVHIPPDGYLRRRRSGSAARPGTLFVCDEVQTGIGRTGRFLALEHWELAPDMICLAKALSGGLVPIGAVLVSRQAFDRVFDGMERAVRHGSTFGGNDLAAAAALATLRVLERDGVVAHAERMGALLLELTRAAGRAPRGRARRARPRPDVGDRAGRAGGRRRPLGVQRGGARPARAVRAAHHRAAVPRAPDPRARSPGHRMNVVKALPSLLIEEAGGAPLRRRAGRRRGRSRARAAAMARFGLRMARGHGARSRPPRRGRR